MQAKHHRHASLFQNGRNQALRIPKEFELPGKEVIIHKEGFCLIIEPVEKRNSLSALLDEWATSRVEFPEILDLPPEDVDI